MAPSSRNRTCSTVSITCFTPHSIATWRSSCASLTASTWYAYVNGPLNSACEMSLGARPASATRFCGVFASAQATPGPAAPDNQ
jgi:hypothetical protein